MTYKCKFHDKYPDDCVASESLCPGKFQNLIDYINNHPEEVFAQPQLVDIISPDWVCCVCGKKLVDGKDKWVPFTNFHKGEPCESKGHEMLYEWWQSLGKASSDEHE